MFQFLRDGGKLTFVIGVLLMGVAGLVAGAAVTGRLPALVKPDRERVTLCASLARILNAPGSTFELSWSDGSDRDGFVKVLYAVSPPGLKPRRRSLACRFAPTDGPWEPPRLLAVISDGSALGAARVGLFNRFWLQSRETAQPLPSGPPDLPPPIRPADAA